MATIDKDLLLDKIDRLLKLHNYAREDWFANVIHNTVLDAPEIETDGDTIYRADAINAIYKHSCYTEYGPCSNVGFPRTACGYVEAIQLLPSAEVKTKCIAQIKVDVDEIVERIKEEYGIMNRWIPCSERLPETPKHYYDRSLYLTCSKTGYITSIYWWDGWNCSLDEDGTVYRKHEMKDIVAWMPLPKPYREDGEE